MNETIGTAYVQIVPTTQGIKQNLADILGSDAESAGEKAGSKLSGALSKASKIGIASVAGIATAMTSATAVIAKGTSATAEYGDNIDKMSQKLGVSSTFYQEWDAVLQHSGTSMDSMSATFKKLATASQNTTQSQAEAFQQLGLSMEQVSSMSTEELFTSVISGLQGMEEGTERTALATELLGRGAMEMGALLNTSATDTQGMIDKVHELGGVLSEDAVKNSAQFQDSLQDMQTAFSGLSQNLMAEFLPSISEVMDGLGRVASGDDEGLGLVNKGISDFIQKLIEMLPKMLDIGTSLITTLGKALLDNLPQITDAAVKLITTLADGIIKNLPTIISGGIEIISKLIVGIIRALPSLIKEAPAIISAVVTGLSSAASELWSAGKDVVSGIWNGIQGAWGDLKNKVSGLASDLVDSIKGFFQIGSPSKLMRDTIGRWIPEGIAVGIDATADSPIKALSDMSANMTTTVQGQIGSDFAYSGNIYGDVARDNNFDNTEEVSLLKSIKDGLVALQNMTVVMDTGATVGALAVPMNGALGRISAREGRR